MTRDELARALSDAAYLEGDFVLRSGRRSQVLPRQVPLRDAPRPARAARPRDRRRRAGARAGSDEARRARARRGRARRRGIPRERPAVPDRPQGSQGLRHRRNGSKACSRRGSVSASSRTSSPPAERPSRRSRRSVTRVSRSRARSASSTAKRAESTRFARQAVRLRPLYRSSELRKDPANPHG